MWFEQQKYKSRKYNMKFYDKQSKRPMWTSFPQFFHPLVKCPIADKIVQITDLEFAVLIK